MRVPSLLVSEASRCAPFPPGGTRTTNQEESLSLSFGSGALQRARALWASHYTLFPPGGTRTTNQEELLSSLLE
eukprot:2474926-Amphidinium_carterae.1